MERLAENIQVMCICVYPGREENDYTGMYISVNKSSIEIYSRKGRSVKPLRIKGTITRNANSNIEKML